MGKDKKDKKNKKRKAEEEPAAAAPEVDEKAAKKAKKAAKKAKKEAAAAAAVVAAAPAVEEEKTEKKKKKKKKDKKEKKEKKEEEPAKVEEAEEEEEEEFKPAAKASGAGSMGGPAPADATPKVFMGNLSYDIDDDKLKEFLKSNGIDATPVDIHWLTDKETGNFYGSGFVEFETVDSAAALVKLAGTDCLGRPIKADFAKPRPGGDRKFTPKKPARPVVALTKEAKPEGCVSMFLANLSFDIDDEALTEWVKDCGEVARIKWITDRETGDFKGCGFVDFYDTDAIDKLAAKQGSDCMGRPIRMDYAKPREGGFGGGGGGGGGGGICFAFQKGECTRGDSCKFKHEKE